jgi:predicted nucleic acid-binding protein
MIVVADTSPIRYLVLIDEIEVLPFLFGHVIIPDIVLKELQDAGTPEVVRLWIARSHDWLEIRPLVPIVLPEVSVLDAGESAAIQLAIHLGANAVLIDEARGRRIAKSLHLEVRGTLGIIERASRLGKFNFRSTLNKLEKTNFRVSDTVREEFLRRNP